MTAFMQPRGSGTWFMAFAGRYRHCPELVAASLTRERGSRLEATFGVEVRSLDPVSRTLCLRPDRAGWAVTPQPRAAPWSTIDQQQLVLSLASLYEGEPS